ncbi:medium chain dehydrogenase/reductase family protein [Paenibacillus kobensis]|uniref:medium chain dehydrogenase/reductase family protein n=1 Tax=Paenibacillus kobensis TaxID=59841 RepID=UPI0013E2DE27|nr:medium chain dehydrogenase/reductase family protein [Paenibacillus kobensis]
MIHTLNRQILITEAGSPDVMKLIESPIPAPGPKQIRIRIQAAGISYADIMMRQGSYPAPPSKFPFVPGIELVGIVDAIGSQVQHLHTGQRVGALPRGGGYADYICVDAYSVIPLPDGADAHDALSIMMNYVTAYQMLHRSAAIKPHARILIHGAAGGVGSALLQLGRLMNLEIYGTASPAKLALVESLGATAVDYKNTDFVEELMQQVPSGFDAIFDPIGGSHLKRSYRLLAKDGRLVVFGFQHAGTKKEVFRSVLPMLRLRMKWNRKRVKFYTLPIMIRLRKQWFQDDLRTLFDLLQQGQIQPVISKRLPLQEAAYAHALMEQGAIHGKMILIP